MLAYLVARDGRARPRVFVGSAGLAMIMVLILASMAATMSPASDIAPPIAGRATVTAMARI